MVEREYKREIEDFIDDVHKRISTVSSAFAYRRWRSGVLEKLYFLDCWGSELTNRSSSVPCAIESFCIHPHSPVGIARIFLALPSTGVRINIIW